jgi:archaetidylinositol phosphate synthase
MNDTPEQRPHSEDRPVDCYSAGDRAFMQWGQKIRHVLFTPLLKVLMATHVTANHLTLAALLCGVLFPIAFQSYHSLGFVLLALHVFFDGRDGPLARAKGTASNSGSFTDTASDQLVVLITTTVFIHQQMLGLISGMIYVFSYTIVVGFSMVRNALGIPYSWLVRPRFAIYLWALVEIYLWPGTLEYLVWTANALLAWKVSTGFYRIRHTL